MHASTYTTQRLLGKEVWEEVHIDPNILLRERPTMEENFLRLMNEHFPLVLGSLCTRGATWISWDEDARVQLQLLVAMVDPADTELNSGTSLSMFLATLLHGLLTGRLHGRS